MPALDPETRERWREMVVVDRDAATVGTIASFYLDQASGLPTWALVRAGWLGDRHSFVPLADAVEAGGEIHLPYLKAQVHQAPEIDPGSELSADDELVLSGHYGLADRHGAVAEPPRPDPEAPAEPEPRAGAAVTGAAPEPRLPAPSPPEGERSPVVEGAGSVVHTPPPEPGEGGLVVTRSEEELAVGVRTRVRRLRLRKYIVTEYVTRTIPVRREKVRLEELSSDQVLEGDGGDWGDDPDPAGTTQLELVLHREEPEIRLRPVPVERVRLVRRVVTEQRTVTGQLRKEQVELEEAPPGERPAPEGT
jgi:hypothetical protein